MFQHDRFISQPNTFGHRNGIATGHFCTWIFCHFKRIIRINKVLVHRRRHLGRFTFGASRDTRHNQSTHNNMFKHFHHLFSPTASVRRIILLWLKSPILYYLYRTLHMGLESHVQSYEPMPTPHPQNGP